MGTYIQRVNGYTHDHNSVSFGDGLDRSVPEDLAGDLKVKPVTEFKLSQWLENCC